MTFVLLFVLVAGVAMAQVAIGQPVRLQAADGGAVPPIAAAQQRGTTVEGDPTTGNYDILVNGWIEAYAKVSAYDNWISFGIMNPTSGSYGPGAEPVRRWAFSQAGEATYKLDGEDGGQDPLYAVNGSTTNFDLAGLQIQTNARLNLLMDMGGYLTRCKSDGTAFAGVDTRRSDAGPYQLRNQVKMALHGKFLQRASSADPAQDSEGTTYASPTSGETTAYNTWTSWGAAGASIIPNETGWFEPTDMINDPWTGGASYVTDGGRANVGMLDLVVERGQAQASGTGKAAEIWWTQRVLRRGLQDAAGNYRADMRLLLTYREADTQWVPPAKP
jgi:hypothetical protein